MAGTSAMESLENRFGYEWSLYREISPLYEEQFLRWIHPLTPADFRGKHVLDAGCGTGRNSLWPLKYGAERVVAFDVDPRTVAVARGHLASDSRAAVEEMSIYDLRLEDEFDIVFSIGVIHHLEKPREAIANLVRATRPGGKTVVWVYGREGHAWLKACINRLRRLTCRMPAAWLNVLVFPLSALFFAYLKSIPHRHPYLSMLRRAPFWQVHSILFDQFLPEISQYWSRDEALALFDSLPVANITSSCCNRGSWTVTATKRMRVHESGA